MFQRRDKQQLQPHMQVARLSKRCYTIIKGELKSGSVKSSTFNCLRKMDEEEQHKFLRRFKASGYDKGKLREANVTKVAKNEQVNNLVLNEML